MMTMLIRPAERRSWASALLRVGEITSILTMNPLDPISTRTFWNNLSTNPTSTTSWMSRLKRNVKRIFGQPRRKSEKKSENKWKRTKWKDKSKKRRRLSSKKTQRIEKKVNSMRKLSRRKTKLSTKCSMIKPRSRRLSMSRTRTVSETSSLNARSWELIA